MAPPKTHLTKIKSRAKTQWNNAALEINSLLKSLKQQLARFQFLRPSENACWGGWAISAIGFGIPSPAHQKLTHQSRGHFQRLKSLTAPPE